jgi:hypothetical protein
MRSAMTLEDIPGTPPSSPEDRRQDSEIAALRRKSTFTLLAALLGPLIALGSLIAAALQWRAARDQVGVAEAQLQAVTQQMREARQRASEAIDDSRESLVAARRQADGIAMLAKAAASSAEASQISAANASRAAATGARQLEATDRPWIRTKLTFFGPLQFSERGMSLPNTVLLFNVGRAVANDVTVITTVKYGTSATEWLVASRQQTDCQTLDNMAKSGFPGLVVFPNAYALQNIFGDVSSEEIARVAARGGSNNHFVPLVVGCVRYRFTYSPIPHHTWFCYIVRKRGEPLGPVFERGERVPVELLESEESLGGNGAD